MMSGSATKRFQASTQAPITSSGLANTRLDSHWRRRRCQTRSAGFQLGLYGGSKMMLSGTSSWPLWWQAAPSVISTAWASAASWALISRRKWFIATVLHTGDGDAGLRQCGHTAPKM
jgi:hypothetical protein